MSSKDSEDSVFIHKLNRASIISLLGSFQKRLDNCEKMLKSSQSLPKIIMIFTMIQFIGFITLITVVLQIQKNISILRTAPNIQEIK